MDLSSAALLAWILLVPLVGWSGFLIYTRVARREEKAIARERIEPRF